MCIVVTAASEHMMHCEVSRLYQLAADTVCCLQGTGVQEVVVAPVLCLSILLVRMVHIEQRQVITCKSRQAS